MQNLPKHPNTRTVMKSRQKPIKSLRSISKIIGRSNSVVAGWAKRPDWPIGSGPWGEGDLHRLKRWMIENLKPAPDAGQVAPDAEISLKSKVQIKFLMKQIERLDQEIAIRGEKYHDAAVCKQRVCSILSAISRRMLAIPNGSPFTPEINNWFAERIRETLTEIAA